LTDGLTCVSNVLVRSAIQENLYHHRWEANAGKNSRDGFAPAHKAYRDTLKQLYILVLKYQATSVCYFTKNGIRRFFADMAKSDDWKSLLEDVKRQDNEICLAYNRLNDIRIEEEFEKQDRRHTESLNVQISMSKDLSSLCKAIETANRDSKRQELLQWLCSRSPEEFYNSVRGKRQENTTTGDWLLKGSEDFFNWKAAPNSLLWLNGKGNHLLPNRVHSLT
jgi:hypothetical protein